MSDANNINYESFRIKKTNDGTESSEVYCIKCGERAGYERFGYTWCEKHKHYLREDPEDLEEIVINRLKELGL